MNEHWFPQETRAHSYIGNTHSTFDRTEPAVVMFVHFAAAEKKNRLRPLRSPQRQNLTEFKKDVNRFGFVRNTVPL
jgi:hypothetical protein